ncbi:MAG: thiamine-phosphate kinase [Actinomycetota bacterium]|nr:thiamine-phosphate kinase [Actinomycetota bacterium]
MASPEFALLAALQRRLIRAGPGIPLGVGDDAAVVTFGGADVAVAVDALVEGVHFDRAISSHADVGWKALAVNVSDLAAVGASTAAAVVALIRPADLPDDAVHALYAGLDEAARRWGVALVGGDIAGGPVLAVTVTVLGRLHTDHPLPRSGARPGDAVIVVGALGTAAAGLAAHRSGRRDVLDDHPQLLRAHRRPEALPEAGAALARHGAHACIDVSDGLGRDLGHVAAASGVRVVVDAERLPVDPGVAATADALAIDPFELVCGGGDDLALVAAVPPDRVADLSRQLQALGLVWHEVGTVTDGDGVSLRLADGSERDISRLGYEHGTQQQEEAG